MDAAEVAGEPDGVPAVWFAIEKGLAAFEQVLSPLDLAASQKDGGDEGVGAESGELAEAEEVANAGCSGQGVVEPASVAIEVGTFDAGVEFHQFGVVVLSVVTIPDVVEVRGGVLEVAGVACEAGASESGEGFAHGVVGPCEEFVRVVVAVGGAFGPSELAVSVAFGGQKDAVEAEQPGVAGRFGHRGEFGLEAVAAGRVEDIVEADGVEVKLATKSSGGGEVVGVGGVQAVGPAAGGGEETIF
jgi:hypothetical protein